MNSVIEDYLKVIYSHTEWQPDPITTGALAARLGLAASSVTEMVKKLVAQGLVVHEPYGAVELTADGTALALRMLRRHRLIETWLVDLVGYRWDEVHDEAEVLEHAMSDRLLDALDVQLGHPVRDPHGDPIPAADGTVQRPDARPLLKVEGGTVVRISDRDPLVLRHLHAEGIGLDSVVRRDDLAAEAAAAVWVVVGLTGA
ncbi:MAG: metal-dependent transcriptional regulator [Actinobacteria bacterium]|nr:metal-dependent transcriptional regulator [Actinomycetota bacterium]